MTTKTASHNAHHPASHAATPKEHAMSKPKSSATAASTTTSEAEATVPAIAASAPVNTALAAPALPVTFVARPPSDVHIPTVDYSPATPGEFVNVTPRVAELTALPQALKDLAAFTAYETVLGTAAPPYADVVQAFTVGSAWSSMRRASKAWDGYCVVQEGFAWRAIRLIMTQLVPVFALAAMRNAKLLTQYPGLASLLGAKKAIAQKGVSTKKLNKKAVAEGKPPTHGAVGKKAQRKAQKEALASAQASTATPPVTPATPVVAAGPPAATASNGTPNGAAH
jgi:hypothetical protein